MYIGFRAQTDAGVSGLEQTAVSGNCRMKGKRNRWDFQWNFSGQKPAYFREDGHASFQDSMGVGDEDPVVGHGNLLVLGTLDPVFHFPFI